MMFSSQLEKVRIDGRVSYVDDEKFSTIFEILPLLLDGLDPPKGDGDSLTDHY